MRRLPHIAVASLLAVVTCSADAPIGGMEFFGYGGLDVGAIHAALPLKEGDDWDPESRQLLQNSVKSIVGTPATDIAAVCCDEAGNRWVYVGLPGRTSAKIRFLQEPTQPIRLPPELVVLHERLEKALMSAVERGGEAIQEDNSQGYALTNDPAARALETQIRDYALAHGPNVYAVLTGSSDARHRAIAAQTAGYAEHTAEQVAVLSRAARDPDREVRNNAIRALGVLASSDVELAAPIPASLFIDLLSSEIWADRNKAAAILGALTRSRESRVLGEIKDRSLRPLIESARWRWIGHSYWPRVILGRVAGIDENTIVTKAAEPDFVDFALSHLRDSLIP